MIVIVDYGMGNLGSIANMLKKIGAQCRISSDHGDIERAEKLILPGVGAFDAAMERIEQGGFRASLERKALQDRIPVLGICLGMQLLTDSSEEGKLSGLGWIPARAISFRARNPPNMKSPQMGWNLVQLTRPSALTQGLAELVEPRFYFVHSYFVECRNPEDSILKTTYGVTYDSGIQMGNIYGVQFHPEKSHRFGMKLLENFARL
jgi:imidazole glycerol-phosphate synthase subunit HisH